jgi:hypothetical protein
VIFGESASVLAGPEVLTNLATWAVELVAILPELLHLEDLLPEENISYPFQIATFSNNRTFRETEASRPEV